MSDLSVCVDAFAELGPAGLRSMRGLRPWESDQRGSEDVRRSQVLAVPYPSFGKLMLPDKLAFSVVSLMLSDYGHQPDRTTGVCLGIPFGSLSTDLRYNETAAGPLPSPGIFSATLPSSPISEIAIFWKLQGPNRVFCGGAFDGIHALDEGRRLVARGKASAIIVVCIWAVEQRDWARGHFAGSATAAPCTACALLLRQAPGVCLNMNLTMNLRTGTDVTEKNNGREYFERVMKLMAERTDGRIRLETPECTGDIVLVRG